MVAGVRLFTAKQRLPSEHLECVVLPSHDGRKGDAESSISIGRVDGLGGSVWLVSAAISLHRKDISVSELLHPALARR
jgi:hypothetical protein